MITLDKARTVVYVRLQIQAEEWVIAGIHLNRAGWIAMTKADLVEEISKDTGLSKKDTSIVVNMIIDNICKALAEGDKVELRGFGSFKVKSRKPRRARNPRTGEAVDVPAKLVPYFKASNELKSKVNV